MKIIKNASSWLWMAVIQIIILIALAALVAGLTVTLINFKGNGGWAFLAIAVFLSWFFITFLLKNHEVGLESKACLSFLGSLHNIVYLPGIYPLLSFGKRFFSIVAIRAMSPKTKATTIKILTEDGIETETEVIFHIEIPDEGVRKAIEIEKRTGKNILEFMQEKVPPAIRGAMNAINIKQLYNNKGKDLFLEEFVKRLREIVGWSQPDQGANRFYDENTGALIEIHVSHSLAQEAAAKEAVAAEKIAVLRQEAEDTTTIMKAATMTTFITQLKSVVRGVPHTELLDIVLAAMDEFKEEILHRYSGVPRAAEKVSRNLASASEKISEGITKALTGAGHEISSTVEKSINEAVESVVKKLQGE